MCNLKEKLEFKSILHQSQVVLGHCAIGPFPPVPKQTPDFSSNLAEQFRLFSSSHLYRTSLSATFFLQCSHRCLLEKGDPRCTAGHPRTMRHYRKRAQIVTVTIKTYVVYFLLN